MFPGMLNFQQPGVFWWRLHPVHIHRFVVENQLRQMLHNFIGRTVKTAKDPLLVNIQNTANEKMHMNVKCSAFADMFRDIHSSCGIFYQYIFHPRNCRKFARRYRLCRDHAAILQRDQATEHQPEGHHLCFGNPLSSGPYGTCQ